MQTCAICIDDISQHCYTLLCGHKFHFLCAEEWVMRSSRKTCPVCRASVAEIPLSQVEWYNISLTFSLLDLSFVKENKHSILWHVVSTRDDLTITFLEKHRGRLDWSVLSAHLSEELLDYFCGDVVWSIVKKRCDISRAFKIAYKTALRARCSF